MRTKWVITIGPNFESPDTLEKLVMIGFDIARINFSHATYDPFLRIKKDLFYKPV